MSPIVVLQKCGKILLIGSRLEASYAGLTSGGYAMRKRVGEEISLWLCSPNGE